MMFLKDHLSGIRLKRGKKEAFFLISFNYEIDPSIAEVANTIEQN